MEPRSSDDASMVSNHREDRSVPVQLQRIHHGARAWSQHPRIRVFVTGLPYAVTTLDIHKNLSQFGEIVFIKVLENRVGGLSSRAEVEYGAPPEKPFWPRKITFRTPTSTSRALLNLSNIQPQHHKIESPIHKDIKYEEKTELVIEKVHFGVLHEPSSMTIFTSRGTIHDQGQLILDLRRRQIDIKFPSIIVSDNGQAIRTFRFQVALDEDFEIWSFQDGGYILNLSRPPWYSKQLKEAIAQTHATGAKRWSVEDTWARQTDIVDHKNDLQSINKLPVSLQKKGNSINIARWTAFKLDIVQNETNLKANQVLKCALRDFNVNVMNGDNFAFVHDTGQLDSTTWSRLQDCSGVLGYPPYHRETITGVLPFAIRYQLEVCLSQGWLSEYSLTTEFLRTLSEVDIAKARQILLHLDATGQREWYPMQLFQSLKYRQPVKFRELPEGCMEIRSAVVTATGIIFNSPTVEVTNRIVRKYKQYVDHFLRVRFEDDKWRGQSRLYPAANNKMQQLFQRVRRVLRHGIDLGNMHYEFLAWGNSQLREHGAYFFAKVGNISAETIRAEMGMFDKEKIVAKRAARMGQCFSTTRTVHLVVPTVTEATTIPDICNGKYNFTDGVGKISMIAAQMIHLQLGIKGAVPSAFQFRLGGCKGVMVVWPDMVGVDLKVRASQFKFSSSSNQLEVIRWSEFWQPFLNRQLIICLSDLGIPDEVFLRMQDETIELLGQALLNDAAALKALRDTVDPNSMTLSLCDLVEAGFRSANEPFVTTLLHLWRSWMLKYLKEKAKIPVRKGVMVLGCADESRTLRGHYDKLVFEGRPSKTQVPDLLPEIFLQISNPQTGQREVITGTCILARNPSLHRGDIRVVRATNVPALRHLCDVVVMPTNGDRDLSSMCSGGDLDGDDYIVIWDPELIPEIWNAQPFHYEAPPAKAAVNNVTTDDIINFFYDYLQNDCLGRIAHAHLGAADFFDEGLQSQACEELVQLHSMAVDYPKTGVPAIMKASLDRVTWPHFMEKKRGNSYRSKKILGQLYDAVEKVAFEPLYQAPFDEAIVNAYKPDKQLRANISALKHDYDSAMQRIMTRHDIKTEFEVFSTFVLSHSKAVGDFKFHEEIGSLSGVLKEQYRHALVELAGGPSQDKLALVAVAAYQYTYEQVKVALKEIEQELRMEGPEGMPFISFPWLLQDTLCWIKAKAKQVIQKSSPKGTEKSYDVDDSRHKVQKWLATIKENPKLAVTNQHQVASEGNKTSADVMNMRDNEHNTALGMNDVPEINTNGIMEDPLNLSIEQMINMGFNEDMELIDEP